MTMFDNRTNLNPAVVKEVRNHFQEVVFETVIPRTIRFGEAPSHGRTILEHDPQVLARLPIARWPSNSWSGKRKAFPSSARGQRLKERQTLQARKSGKGSAVWPEDGCN